MSEQLESPGLFGKKGDVRGRASCLPNTESGTARWQREWGWVGMEPRKTDGVLPWEKPQQKGLRQEGSAHVG